MASDERDSGAKALEDLVDALAIVVAYRHGAGSELVGQLLQEAKAQSTWYGPPDLGTADDETSRELRKLHQDHSDTAAELERVTRLLYGMRNLSDVLLDNWAKSIGADPDEILEAIGHQIAEVES